MYSNYFNRLVRDANARLIAEVIQKHPACNPFEAKFPTISGGLVRLGDITKRTGTGRR